ncbi:MAG TPA: hypothetical protein VM261_20125 [Kofleriaceae bacterium]|nr:hypothetical protein [Kofleriaceae bacterium]
MRVVVGAVVAAIVTVLAHEASADACAPAAVVIGDDGLVRAIELELRARGIEVAGDAGAPVDGACAVHAEVAPEVDHRIRVTVTDGDGRTVERVTADAGTAATAIESWARRDMTDPLLAGHGVILPSRGPHAVDRPVISPAAPARRLEVGAALDSGLSNDGALWGGVRGRACARVGDACVGVQIRYGRDLEVAGDSAALDNSRSALDLTVTVELPLERDRWSVAPVAGAGQSSLTAVRDLVDEEETEQASTWHLFAGIGAGARVGAAWRVRLDAGVALSPTAAARLGESDGVDRQLAALPKARGWLGLGLSYEGL